MHPYFKAELIYMQLRTTQDVPFPTIREDWQAKKFLSSADGGFSRSSNGIDVSLS